MAAPLLSRRTALRSALAGGSLTGLAATTGCGRSGGSAPASQDVDPDRALLDLARGELHALVALVAGTRARHRRLRAGLRESQRSHEAALSALDGDLDPLPPVDPPTVPAAPAAALAQVRRRQERVRRRLLDGALDARSGALARLLAAGSAGVAQQALTGPVTVPGQGG